MKKQGLVILKVPLFTIDKVDRIINLFKKISYYVYQATSLELAM